MKKVGKQKTSRGWMIPVLAILLVGAGLTVRDYGQWRRAETEKYGRGREEIEIPAMVLSRAYLDREAGIRIPVPEGWEIIPDTDVSGTTAAVRIGRYLRVIPGTATNESMTDLTDRRTEELAKTGITLDEREYVRSEKAELTILQWTEEKSGGGAEIRQEAWTENRGRTVRIEVKVGEGEWLGLKNTLREIYRNLSWI